jgi:Helix-turn-helix domain
MPWKECHVMDERLRFVARLLDGERMTTLCTEFGISRKTGYKIYDRYKAHGAVGLTDRSRRPLRHANQLPTVIERLIVRLKKRYPTWGAPKIREKLRPQCAPVRCPRDQHGACGPGSSWPGAPPTASAALADRHPRRASPNRTHYGARISKANSCSRIAATATR